MTMRILGGVLIVVLVGLILRSALLPAQTAAVFINYAEDRPWQPAPTSPLFDSGQLEFAGYEPVQLGGQDLGVWDEVVIASFATTAAYDAFSSRLEAAQNIDDYHLMELAPQPPELLAFTNWRLRSFRNDDTIDPGEKAPIEDVVPDYTYLPRWQALFQGAYRGGIVMLNLMVHADNPRDPTGDADSGASGEELYERYSDKATRLLGKLGGQIAVLGSVERVAVGPEIRQYDVYAFVYYPSVDVFDVMFTARERVDAQVYQRAGLNTERSAGYWVKPYPEFMQTAM